MMGLEVAGDKKIPIVIRDWNGMKLALWRSKEAWEIAKREAEAILSRCRHKDNCPAIHDETRPCLSDRYEKHLQGDGETDEDYAARQGVRVQEGCPDRELRMSASVILNAARMFAPIDARRPAAEPYTAPSREYFSEVIGELGAAQLELDVLRAALQEAGAEVPTPIEQSLLQLTPSPQTEKLL
jgi:hypothetical protein